MYLIILFYNADFFFSPPPPEKRLKGGADPYRPMRGVAIEPIFDWEENVINLKFLVLIRSCNHDVHSFR